MQKSFFISILIGLCFWSTGSSVAAPFQMLVLPLHISGKLPASGISDTVFAERLQNATHFLVGQEKQVQLLDIAQSRAIVKQSSWRSSNPYAHSGLSDLCRKSDAAYLLMGRAFFSNSGLSLEMRAYSCRLGRELGQAEEKSDLAALQSVLRHCIRRSTPFLNARPGALPATHIPRNQVDLAVVLDTSGSMVHDLPSIHRSLTALAGRVPHGSRLGLISVNAGDRLDIQPFSTSWRSSLDHLARIRASGENSTRGLLNALSIVHRYREWKGNRRLILFSDAPVGSRRQSQLETALRRLNRQGVQISIYPLMSQTHADRVEWNRMRRTLQLKHPPVVYARRLDVLGMDSYFLLSAGNRFYQSRPGVDLLKEFNKSSFSIDSMLPVESASYSGEDLNLQRLPAAFAARKGHKLQGIGPILSNLERVIVQQVEDSIQFSAEGGSRVLVRNQGRSFWLAVRDDTILRQMERNQGQKIYLGLHAMAGRTGGERVQFLPNPIYLQPARSVPRLFVTTYEQLNRIEPQAIRSSDIWFLHVEILEIRNQ